MSDYVKWRESKIPLAETMADARCPRPEGDDADLSGWSWRWDAAFHRAMAELTADPFAPTDTEVN